MFNELSLSERVFARLILESSIGKTAGLGAFVSISGAYTSAYIYDTNLLIDYLRYGDEFIDRPMGSEGRALTARLETRRATKDRILRGFVEIKSPDTSTGNCHDASIISLAAGPGFGKEIYGLAYALSPNGLLAPDRGTVSNDATLAWKNAAAKGRARHKFDDWKLKETPPLEDDCKMHTDPDKEHLNYAYEAEGWEKGLLKYLSAQHDATLDELTDIPHVREEVEGLIASVAIGEFWQKHYWKR